MPDAAEAFLPAANSLMTRLPSGVRTASETTTRAKLRPFLPQRLDVIGDFLDFIRNFGNEDDIRAARNARRDGDMPRVAAHDFKDHNAVMARGGGLEPVERFGCNRNGGIETDRDFRHADIVVDGLGNADERKAAFFRKAAQDIEAAVAADADQRIAFQRIIAVDDFLRTFFDRAVRHRVGERIAFVSGAEDRSALPHHHRIDIAGMKRHGLRRIGSAARECRF